MNNRQFYPDLMLDLETLGNTPRSAIVQIGACYFNMATGEIGKEFCKDISVIDACKYGEMTASTVLWWLQQSKKAQDNVFGTHNGRQGLSHVLEQFLDMVEGVENVWCHVDFDWPILQHAYKAVGLKFPFKYWMGQHLRTIVKVANVDLKTEYVREGIHHNALDDCKFQVKYVVGCYYKLKGDVWNDLIK